MNTFRRLATPLVAVLSLAAAGAALADDVTPDDTATQVFGSTKTRQQVQQELFAARADGSIKVWSTSYNPLTVARSLRSREEVRAEARTASRNPAFAAAMYGEDSGSFALARTPRTPRAVDAPVYAGRPGDRAAQ